jgi:N4-gp56 family major capsid protein
MVSPQVYGDISPRTAAYAVAQMLKRGAEELILEKFGQAYPIPTKSTTVAKFRRYNALALATTPLQEGVTPTGKKLTVTDVTATLAQYGDWVPYSDIIEDTHEDPYLQQLTEVLMQQASETVETIRWNVIKAGTNVFYANGTVRTDVNTPISLTSQRKVTRALKRQRGKHLTSIVASDARFRTEPVEAAFIAICHSDVENDVRNMEGFVNTKQYGTVTPWANEIGAVEDVRYIRSVLFTPFADAGAATSTMVSTTGTVSDVYPVIYIAKDSYGIVPLKGKAAMSIMVVNPKPVHGDPLGQRGSAGWKTMQTSVILNDLWIGRLEVAATN